MAKNDKILIDGIIDDRLENKIPSDKRDEVFEYFVFEQLLKDYDLSKEELEFGSVDGRNDGGIDGFFIFVNGHLLIDTDKFLWPKSGSILEVWIITCKHHDTFKQAPLDNLVASISELFDFALADDELKGDYSSELIFLRNCLKQAYRKVSPRLREFKVNYLYSSRGNKDELGESIISRGKQAEQITKDFFGNCQTIFDFVGSTELVDLHRKAPNFSLELPFSDDLSSGETYILLVKLKDYFNFLSDNGKLRRYLFDSNVRDFMGLNRVNEDIRNTLLNDNSPDFWWLNNGITILATGASVVGKSIQIQDIQIVNGLQTSESIFRYFDGGGTDIKNRSVLVKVIVSNNPENRDEIIRATNNQTIVELAALHATDKIQRDIEEALKLDDFYYERRTNFYKNQGAPQERIVTPLYLASGFLSLILKAPEQASTLKSKFMRIEDSYNKVFSNNTDLQIWSKIAFILKITDAFLETKRPNVNGSSEHFLKYRRHFVSFLALSKVFENFNFTIYDLIKLDNKKFTFQELEESWGLIKTVISSQFSKSKLKRGTFLQLCEEINKANNIKGYDRLIHNFGINNQKFIVQKRGYKSENNITADFIEKVDSIFPQQPWKPGTHKLIAKQLSCTESEIFSAVNILIKSGKRYKQKDGIIYDKSGRVIEIDKERVDEKTLKLKNE
ncbi:MAG: AIPR family protein [Bacteroidia bacterium]